MRPRFSLTALVLGWALLLQPAAAATIASFGATTNDGWFSLTQAQADFLGQSDATGIAMFRVRQGGGLTLAPGDVFDQSSIFNSVISGASNILALVNGTNPNLGYTGGAFEALGLTTIGALTSYPDAVGILMSNLGGNVVFRGSATFNVTEQSLYRGALDLVVPAEVPLPAGLPLLIAGLAGIGLAARRRRA